MDKKRKQHLLLTSFVLIATFFWLFAGEKRNELLPVDTPPAQPASAAQPAVGPSSISSQTPPVRPPAQSTSGPAYVPDQYLVKFSQALSEARKQHILRTLGAEIVKEFRSPKGLALLRLPRGVTVEQARLYFSTVKDVELAEPNFIYRPAAFPDDPDFSKLWGLHNTGQTGGVRDVDINAPEAWEQTTGSEDIVIGVIDTGIDYTHLDLAANAWINPEEIPDNNLDDDNNGWVDDIHGIDTFHQDADPLDDHGHGTHVFGTIAARGNNGIGIAGVMWQAKVIGCKFIGAGGEGTLAGALGCLEYFTILKERGVNLVATNNSWGGGGFSQLLYDAIDTQGRNDVLFIASAGNDRANTDFWRHYPSSYDLNNIISVASIDSYGYLSFFSNYGASSVDIAAPGERIYSTLPGNNWGSYSGTSMATPHVTGIVGLYKANQPQLTATELKSLVMETGQDELKIRSSVLSGKRARIALPSIDADGDGMPDQWELTYGLAPADPGDAAQDADADGLSNLEEFTHQTDPRAADSDADGLTDGEEINLYQTNPLSADTDSDGLPDRDEIATYATDPNNADSDGDGLSDGDEINHYGSDPQSSDSDADGMADGWEADFDLNPTDAGDAATDIDGDGLSNAEEFNRGTQPTQADSDGDGLADGDEIATYGTDPALSDSDGDGMPDGWEITYLLDPLLAADARGDADSDGYINRTEFLLDTDPRDASSVPSEQPWYTYQGNAGHSGYLPVASHTEDFATRWLKTYDTVAYNSSPIVTRDTVYLRERGIRHDQRGHLALSLFDGSVQWRHTHTGVSGISGPAYAGGKIYTIINNAGSNDTLYTYRASSGSHQFSELLTGKSEHDGSRPYFAVPYENAVYLKDGDSIASHDVETGERRWISYVGDRDGIWAPAVNDQYVVAFGDGVLTVLDRVGGHSLYKDTDTGCPFDTDNKLALEEEHAIVLHGGCLSRFDVPGRRLAWEIPMVAAREFSVDSRFIYVVRKNQLLAIDKQTGTAAWEWESPADELTSNVVVTFDHAFIASDTTTYAIDLTTRQQVWDYPVGGRLALSDQGALLIKSLRGKVAAVNIEQDHDGDGMPSWWERHFGLNFLSAADANSDRDGDGLSNGEEFDLGTAPDHTDSDRDGLNDYDESRVYHSDPAATDTDGDGIDDGTEVGLHSTDPTLVDTDGDGISDASEILRYGTDPTDANSQPQLLDSYYQSFENGVPDDWARAPAADAGWELDTGEHTHGNASLRASAIGDDQVAAIEWQQRFSAGEISFDVKVSAQTCCDQFHFYLDGRQVATVANGEWQSVAVPVAQGEHRLRWEYAKNGGFSDQQDTVWIDNIRFHTPEPVATNRDNILAVYIDHLHEFDRDGAPVRAPIPIPGAIRARDAVVLPTHDIAIVDHGLVHIYTPETGRFFTTAHPEISLSNLVYAGQVAVHQGLIYVPTLAFSQGIVRLDLNGRRVDTILTGQRYIDIASGLDGRLYALKSTQYFTMGSGTVLDIIDPQTATVIDQIVLDATDGVGSIAVAANGDIFGATLDSGEIIHFGPSGQRLASTAAGNGADLDINPQGLLAFTDRRNELGRILDDLSGLKAVSISTHRITGQTFVATVSREGVDLDGDGLPDWWERVYGLNPNDPIDAADDPDGDGLSNLQEFEANAKPTEADSDDDGIHDGDEVTLYGSNPRDRDSDDDNLTDGTEVHDYQSNPVRSDTDGDGLSDNDEIIHHLTAPDVADTDGDGAGDGWEVSNNLNPTDVTDGVLDDDNDGLTNSEEFQHQTDITTADTDGDGLSDGEEVYTHQTDPLSKDTDGDRLRDDWELEFGFDPHSALEVTADADGDSFTNEQEFFNGTDPRNPDSFPSVQPWYTHQGNAAHTGYVPVTLDPADFNERWKKLISTEGQPLHPVAAANGRVFVTFRDNWRSQRLTAVDGVDGEIDWQHDFGRIFSTGPPAYANGTVYLQTGNGDGHYFVGLSGNTGVVKFQTAFDAQWPNYFAPTPFGGQVYTPGGFFGGVYGYDGDTGEELWFTDLVHYSLWTPAADDRYLYAYLGENAPGLNVIDRLTGVTAFNIADPEFDWNTWSMWMAPVLGTSDNVIAVQNTFSGGRLLSFDRENHSISWQLNRDFSGQPALAKGIVYAIDSGDLTALDERDGSELWRWRAPTNDVINAMVVTDSHVFVSTATDVHAVDIETHQSVWHYEESGHLALGDDGALYIATRYGMLVSINIEPLDQDGDLMPNWWERLYGLDANNAADALEDPDSDGLNNLAEFNARTNPRTPDTDGDGLDDNREVNEHHSNPNNPDTDGDGLSDQAEIVQYQSNPLSGDSDGDGLSDGEEVNTFQSSPIVADTDNDGLPDGEEQANGLDLHDATDAAGDADNDGLNNLQEFQYGTNLHQPDTDDDGLSDGDEVLHHGTDPLNRDSDGDRQSDNWEIVNGLDPLSSGDSDIDSDGDGYTNLDEFLADANPKDEASQPFAQAWVTHQGNASQNGYLPITLNPTNFALRWTKDVLPDDESAVKPVVVADGKVFAVSEGAWSSIHQSRINKTLTSIDSRNGAILWQYDFGDVFNLGAPAYANGTVYLQTNKPDYLWGFNADIGDIRFRTPFGIQWSDFLAPTPFEGRLYARGGYYSGVYGYDQQSGTELWHASENDSAVAVSVDSSHVYTFTDGAIPALNILDRHSGELVDTIPDPKDPWLSDKFTPVLTGQGRVVLIRLNRLMGFDLEQGTVTWNTEGDFWGDPVAAHGVIYAVESGDLVAYDERQGVELWRWQAPNTSILHNLVLTNDHIFVSTNRHVYAVSLMTRDSVWQYEQGGSLALSNEGALYIATSDGRLVAIDVEGDRDGDGMPDWWERLHRLNPASAGDATGDVDGDGLSNLEEAVIGANPTVTDSDSDGVSDGDEVNLYGSDPLSGDTDKDGLTDGDEVNVYDTDPSRSDTDGDGLPDGDEVNRYLSNPLSVDSDNDGMFDGWEVSNGFDLNDSTDAAADKDNDGLDNAAEFTRGTDVARADSDRDGLTDGDEVFAHNTSPTAKDSDGDRLADGWEIEYGFNPLSIQEADRDTDNDGYTDVQEYFAGTHPLDSNLHPVVKPWSTFQGNAAHTGYVPVTLDPSLFEEHWVKDVLPEYVSPLNEVAAANGKVFITGRGYNDNVILTVADSADGSTVWQRYFGEMPSVSPPAYANGTVFVQAGFETGGYFWGLDAESGGVRMQTPYYARATDYVAPTPKGDHIYAYGNAFSGQGRVYGYDTNSGTELWINRIPEFTGWTPAVDDKYLYTYTGHDSRQLAAIDRITGITAFVIADDNFVADETPRRIVPILGSQDNLIVAQGDRLLSFDLYRRQISWELQGGFDGQPALANGVIYTNEGDSVAARDERSGQLLWRWSSSDTTVIDTLLVTNKHLFVSTASHVYAIDMVTRQSVWSYPRGGKLALGNAGILYIATSGGDLIAIAMNPDSDGDGISNQWEQHHGTQDNNPADAAFDTDGDRLDTLSEFYLGTLPGESDSDRDGIADGDEVYLYRTDPTRVDSDGDGLGDREEIYTYNTNPRALDSDRDHLSDSEEIARYQTNPNAADSDLDGFSDYREINEGTNPLAPESIPPIFRRQQQSFESGAIPYYWTNGAGADNGWIVAGEGAGDGSFALHSLPIEKDQSAIVDWVDTFEKTVLLFDLKMRKDDSHDRFRLYVGEQRVIDLSDTAGEWQRHHALISPGKHRLRLEYSRTWFSRRFGDRASIDNMQFIAYDGDMDADTLPDGWEAINGLNPRLAADAGRDEDGDALSNSEEYRFNTNPFLDDTDSDGMPDGWEVTYQLDPNMDDANQDPDGDSLTNLQEFRNGTNPRVVNEDPVDPTPDPEPEPEPEPEPPTSSGGDSGSGGGGGGGMNPALLLVLALFVLARRWRYRQTCRQH